MEPRRVRQGSVVQGRCQRKEEQLRQSGGAGRKSAFRGERGGGGTRVGSRHATARARGRAPTVAAAAAARPSLAPLRAICCALRARPKLGRTDPTETTAFGERGTAAGAERPTRGRASARARPLRRAYRLPAVAGRVSDRRGPAPSGNPLCAAPPCCGRANGRIGSLPGMLHSRSSAGMLGSARAPLPRAPGKTTRLKVRALAPRPLRNFPYLLMIHALLPIRKPTTRSRERAEKNSRFIFSLVNCRRFHYNSNTCVLSRGMTGTRYPWCKKTLRNIADNFKRV